MCGMLTADGSPEKHCDYKNSHRIPIGRLPQKITLKMTGWSLCAHTLGEVEPSAARESGDQDQTKARSLLRYHRCQAETDFPPCSVFVLFVLHFRYEANTYRHIKKYHNHKIRIRTLNSCSFLPYYFALIISKIFCRCA